MKIAAFILLTFCLQIKAAGYGQKITISFKDVPVEKVFSEIRKQTGYQFLYINNQLQNAKKVTIQVSNASLEDVLSLCCKNQLFNYEIKDRTIIIKLRSQTTARLENLSSSSPVNIKGRITNENGEAVIVAVAVKGTNRGTTTNKDGEFTLPNVDENAVLIISGIGIETTEIKLNGKTDISVIVKISIKPLDETVVIAYGTTTKRLNTGNVSTIKAVDIEKQPINNPLLALEGRVPGLSITQATGLPGSGVKVLIQGQSSISFQVGNDPLYVIDGVPYTSRLLWTLSRVQGSSGDNGPSDQKGLTSGAGNPLSFINPADIESIDVLKDADATAIYGSRAANGAILITTKKGKAGQTKVNINIQNGWGKVTRKLHVLNAEQYLEMRHEAKVNANSQILASDYDINGTWDTTRQTDWQKELIGGTAHYTDAQASVSGGNANTQFLAGAGYHRETTVFPGNFNDKKGSVHFNITNVSNNHRFHFQLSGNYMSDDNELLNRDLTEDAVKLAPVAPRIYNDDGSLNWALLPNGNSTWQNPLSYLYNTYSNKTNNLIGNSIISYEVLPGLDIKSNFGYTNLQSNEILLYPMAAVLPDDRPNTLRSVSFGNTNISSWIVEPQLNYKRNIGKGKLETLIGATIQQNNSSLQNTTGYGASSDLLLKDINSSPYKGITNVYSTYKYNALFSRINYNWQDKYLINLAGRRDGSSRFGSKNQFHNFGSVGIGWIFSNESFIKSTSSFLSFGKLRSSYGTTGNDQIGDYKFLNLYNSVSGSVPYQGMTGLLPTGLPNPYFGWEETKKLQFGLDLGLFNDRLLFTTNYYQNRSSSELLSYALPIITGFTGVTRNFPATVQNYGWEFTLGTENIIKKDLKWSTNINLTIPKNKLVNFPNLDVSSYANALVVGKPITIQKVFHYAGVDPSTGIYQFLDRNGNIASTLDNSLDRTIIINTAPKFYGGFQNTFTYKGFSLDILFQYVSQIGPNTFVGYSPMPGRAFGLSNSGNQPSSILERWRKFGDNASIQRVSSIYSSDLSNAFGYASSSDVSYSNASYIRLKNLSLSWQMPETIGKKIHLQNCRIYIQGQNLLTKTNYQGMDPETTNSITLPPLRILTIGVQITL